MAQTREEELRAALAERLRYIQEDPSYEGAEPTRKDQLVLAFVGLVIPALLMIGGWVLYGG